MSTACDLDATVDAIGTALGSVADPAKAPAMAVYMKNHSAFLGVPKPQREAATQQLVRALTFVHEADLQGLVVRLWMFPEREFHYVANDVLVRHGDVLTEASLPFLRQMIVTNSWWDSVDGLVHVVGDGVVCFLPWVPVMRQWATDPNRWIRRVAIFHQLGRKHETDVDRLIEIVLANAADREFFIRKAIGWALRDFAWSMPDRVIDIVHANRAVLSPLPRREALKNIAKITAQGRMSTPNR